MAACWRRAAAMHHPDVAQDPVLGLAQDPVLGLARFQQTSLALAAVMSAEQPEQALHTLLDQVPLPARLQFRGELARLGQKTGHTGHRHGRSEISPITRHRMAIVVSLSNHY